MSDLIDISLIIVLNTLNDHVNIFPLSPNILEEFQGSSFSSR